MLMKYFPLNVYIRKISLPSRIKSRITANKIARLPRVMTAFRFLSGTSTMHKVSVELPVILLCYDDIKCNRNNIM